MASSAMPKQKLSIRDKIKGRLSFLGRPVPTLSSPSHSLGIPSALSEGTPTPAPSGLLEASPEPSPSPRASAEPSSDLQQRPGGTFDTFVDGADPPQTTVKLAGDMAYKGFKALLDVLDKVGYSLPPLKAAAAGLSRVMTVIDVCTAASQWVTAGTNKSHETDGSTEQGRL